MANNPKIPKCRVVTFHRKGGKKVTVTRCSNRRLTFSNRLKCKDKSTGLFRRRSGSSCPAGSAPVKTVVCADPQTGQLLGRPKGGKCKCVQRRGGRCSHRAITIPARR